MTSGQGGRWQGGPSRRGDIECTAEWARATHRSEGWGTGCEVGGGLTEERWSSGLGAWPCLWPVGGQGSGAAGSRVRCGSCAWRWGEARAGGGPEVALLRGLVQYFGREAACAELIPQPSCRKCPGQCI